MRPGATAKSLPELQLLMHGGPLALAWEFLQSPFYSDTFTAAWTTVVYNRLHCTGGDLLILLGGFWLVALGWGREWMTAATQAPLRAFVGLSLAYTAFSEYYNVHLVQRWAYSSWMPTIAGIGLVPLLQWLVVPMLSVYLVRRCGQRQRIPAA